MPVQPQSQPVIDISPPSLGSPNQQGDVGPLSDFELPLVGGVPFSTLGDLLRQAMDKSVATRGAREIALYRRAAPGVVLIKTQSGSGSGIVLPNGYVVTNRHVVEGVGVVQVFFKSADAGRSERGIETRVGRVRAVDPSRDLAILQLDSVPSNQPTLNIATKDELEIGADVFAIGHPLGFEWTFTQGIVSGIRKISEDGQSYTAIQTQTPINPGNSGGPLLNAGAEVVGINTWARDISSIDKRELSGTSVTVARPAQGLNFAVSAKDIRAFLGDVTSGKISTLPLKLADGAADCMKKPIFNGRNKSNNAQVKVYSLRCDDTPDAWKIEPDDKAKPIELHFDPDRVDRSTIIVLSNAERTKWDVSYWDFFNDKTFAVIGRHESGEITPTRFEFAQS